MTTEQISTFDKLPQLQGTVDYFGVAYNKTGDVLYTGLNIKPSSIGSVLEIRFIVRNETGEIQSFQKLSIRGNDKNYRTFDVNGNIVDHVQAVRLSKFAIHLFTKNLSHLPPVLKVADETHNFSEKTAEFLANVIASEVGFELLTPVEQLGMPTFVKLVLYERKLVTAVNNLADLKLLFEVVEDSKKSKQVDAELLGLKKGKSFDADVDPFGEDNDEVDEDEVQ